jgi:hypothetical protein
MLPRDRQDAGDPLEMRIVGEHLAAFRERDRGDPYIIDRNRSSSASEGFDQRGVAIRFFNADSLHNDARLIQEKIQLRGIARKSVALHKTGEQLADDDDRNNYPLGLFQV